MRIKLISNTRKPPTPPRRPKLILIETEALKNVSSKAPKLNFGEVAPSGERWITVRPGGEDGPGHPVLVKTEPSNPNKGRIIGGAGGKLNQTQVHLKSPEEYRKHSAEKRKARREKARQAKADRAARGESAEESQSRSKAHEEVKVRKRDMENHALRQAAEALGWSEEVLEPAEADLEGLDDEGRAKATEQHRRAKLKEVRDLARQARRILAGSAEARAQVGLDPIPLKGNDERLGAEDLIGEQGIRQSLGYKKDRADISDDNLRAEKIRVLENRVRGEIEAGDVHSAARLAQRVAAHRDVSADDIEAAHPAELAGFAREVARRIEAMDAVRELQDGDADPIDEIQREALDEITRWGGGLHEASKLAASADGAEDLRQWLKTAADVGLLDKGAADERATVLKHHRFEAVGAPRPDELTADQIDQLTDEQIDVLAQEAAARARKAPDASADLRKEAAEVAPGGERRSGGRGGPGGRDENDTRTIDLEDAIKAQHARDEMALDGMAEPEMDPHSRREFLRKALEQGLVGGAGDDSEGGPAGEAPEAGAEGEEASEQQAKPPRRINTPEEAAKMLLIQKKLASARRWASKARRAIERGEEVDGVDYDRDPANAPGGADKDGFVNLSVDHDSAEVVRQTIEDEIRTTTARSLLDEVARSGQKVADHGMLEAEEADQALHTHLAWGVANALNEHGQTLLGGPAIDRQAIDLLGAAGSAQLMAHALHKHFGDDVEHVAEALGDHHQASQVDVSEKAMAQARDAYHTAHEIHALMEEEGRSGDLAEWKALNAQRLKLLDEAHQHLGRALGQLEATASLHLAAKQPPPEAIRTSLGGINPEAAIKQAYALGLTGDDFDLNHDGESTWLTLKPSGMDKLVAPVDHDAERLHTDMAAIKRGDRDEEGWLAKGFARRSDAPEYAGPAAEAHAEDYDYALKRHDDHHQALASYVGSRVNDGWSASRIHADLIDDKHRQAIMAAHPGGEGDHPELAEWDAENKEPQKMAPSLFGADEITSEWATWKQKRDDHAASLGPAPADDSKGQDAHRAFTEALDQMLPARNDGSGTRQRSEHFEAQAKEAADAFIRDRREGDTAGALHHQVLHPEHAHDAAFRALARHPAAVVAFKGEGEQITSKEQSALRMAYHQMVAAEGTDAPSPDHAVAEWAKENPEPEKMAPSLFGDDEVTEGWRAWKRERDQIHTEAAEAHRNAEPMSWSDYVFSHGGAPKAYEAVKDLVRGHFLSDFKAHYEGLAQQPLKAGAAPIANWSRHLQALDPEWRAAMRSDRAKAQASEQKRTGAGGKFGAGEVREKTERRLEDDQAAKEQQVTAFSEAHEPESDGTTLGAHERVTLGDKAEAQIAEAVARHSDMIDPTRPFAARTGVAMDGKFVKQQRAIKAMKRAKKIGLFLGTGSGKTNVAFGSFGELQAEGKARRGLFAVPSVVQGQFGTEALSFLEPGQLKWWADTGASREERLRAYQRPDRHMVVVTHQALRDDITAMVATHLGMPAAEVKAKMTGRSADGEPTPGWSREEMDGHVKDALSHHKADGLLDFLAMDEAHQALNREGKQDSHLARVFDSLGRVSKHVAWMTGTPVKNDASEVYDWLAKVAHHKYHGGEGGVSRSAFMRRYGSDLPSAQRALKREIERYTFTGEVDPGTTPNFQRDQIKPTEAQATRLADIDKAYEHITTAHRMGEVDIEAAKVLAPKAFEGQPESKHREIAHRYHKAAGTAREAAYNHAINIHDDNAKHERVRDLAKKYRAEGRKGVVFAHNKAAIEALSKKLEADGHKVSVIKAGTAAAQQEAARRLNDPNHPDPADIAVVSDAGSAGINLQNADWLVHLDTPHTHMTWKQRTARINRLGQKRKDIDVHTLAIDHDYEHRAHERFERKRALSEAMRQPPPEDDTGLAHHMRQRLSAKHKAS